MRQILIATAAALALPGVPAAASTAAADAKVELASAAACLKAAALRGAQVGPVVRFSDSFGVDIRTVTGKWPQPHMAGMPPARMVCIFDRRTRQAEAQEEVVASRGKPETRR